MTTTKHAHLHVGQKVIVIRNGNHPRIPTARHEGEIVKIARAYATIRWSAYEDGSHPHEDRFLIETGTIYHPPHRGGVPGIRFVTPEQAEAEQRRSAAVQTLREYGIARFDTGRLNVAQLEAMVRAIEEHADGQP